MRLLSWLVTIVLFSTLTNPVLASRKDTYEAMEALQANWQDNSIAVLLNGRSLLDVVSGDKLVYRIESTESGYLTLLHINSHGAAKLVYSEDAERWLVSPEQSIEFPAPSDKLKLTAPVSPLGMESIYAIVTDLPLDPPAGSSARGGYIIKTMDKKQLHGFIDFVNKQSQMGGLLGLGEIRYDVAAEPSGTEYKTRFVEDYFTDPESVTKNNAGKKGKKLASHIKFANNSAELTLSGKRNLDVFGNALYGDKLAEAEFVITGHTDNVGADQYNLELSRQRASRVKAYLIDSFGIEDSRLTVKYKGEADPVAPNDNDANRAKNRRVEFSINQ